MKRLIILIGIAVVGLAITTSALAEPKLVPPANELDLPALPITIPSLNANKADWTFAGIVLNENGERYNYYFQIQRNNNQYHATATLIDGQNREVLLYEQTDLSLVSQDGYNWQIGRAFLQFNPINNSWIFGVKTAAKRGFNFKIDMLSKSAQTSNPLSLRTGVKLLISQSGRLNGHLQTGEQEQFVTAPKTWFRQLWALDEQAKPYLFTGILCEFNDGNGFYAVNLHEAEALRGAVAGWRNMQGMPVPISQFINVKQSKNNRWSITIPSPKMRLVVHNLLAEDNAKHQLIAGLIEGHMAGFCTINMDNIDTSPS